MPRGPLGRAAARARAKKLVHRLVLGRVIAARRGTVKVDVIDLSRVQAGARERALHGKPCPSPFRMWRRHMVGSRTLADAEQANPGRARTRFFELGKTRALADGDSVPADVERAAGPARSELERTKAIERGEAQRIGPADHRGVAYAGGDHARRVAEDLGRRGAGAGHDERRPGEPEPPPHEI